MAGTVEAEAWACVANRSGPRRSVLGVTAIVIAVALGASACVADDVDPEVAFVSGDGALTIVMDEFSYLPSRIYVEAGSTVELTLVNEGSIEHEFMIGNGPLAAGGYEHDLLGPMMGPDQAPDPTRIAQTTTTVPDGHDNSDGHHDSDTTVPDGHDNSDGHHDSDTTVPDGSDTTVPDGHGHDGDEMTPGDDDHHDGTAGGHGGHVLLGPGETVQIVLTVPADAVGEWQIGCFLEGHYEAGMIGRFTVGPELT